MKYSNILDILHDNRTPNNRFLNNRLLRNALHAMKEFPDSIESIIDSFSDNQHLSKESLIDCLDMHGLITKDSKVIILGCWYGSILIDRLSPMVKEIVAIDKDETAIKIGKILFEHHTNIEWINADIFNDYDKKYYEEPNIIINTSCEHMKNMVEWEYWNKYNTNPLYMAFQSNDMFDIKDHINCVKTMDDFRDQLPKGFWLKEESLKDSRGTRFMLVGQYLPDEEFVKMNRDAS